MHDTVMHMKCVEKEFTCASAGVRSDFKVLCQRPTHVEISYCLFKAHFQSNLPCLQGFVGLRNVTLNCYANSVLQCLTAIPEFGKLYLSRAAEQGPGLVERPVTVALSALMRTMWAATDAVNPYRWGPTPSRTFFILTCVPHGEDGGDC